MPEPRDLPLFRSDETLRRGRISRRTRRLRTAAAASAGTLMAALAGTLIWPPRPAFVWNPSASSPIGLYRVTPAGRVGAGDMVVAWPPDRARRLASRRGYLPVNVPLVKRVAAVQGDSVCAAGEAVFLNGRFLALRRSVDSAGRPLPWWTGCRRLQNGDLFLLTAGAGESFDGRYFGITARRFVIGRARLIWRR